MSAERRDSASAPLGDGEVMASLDDDGVEDRLVIADISTDDAWVSVRAGEAPALTDWR